MKDIKIVGLVAESVKRIDAVELTFDQNGLTVIGGRNRQGKTSILSAIEFALGGGRKKPSELKTEGAEMDPFIQLTLSNGLIVERAGKNSALKVTDPNGMKGNQGLLDSFVSEFALNVGKFLSEDPKEQRRLVMRALGDEAQFDALSKREKELTSQRTVINRDLKRQQAALETVTQHPRVDRVDVRHLMQQRDAAERKVRAAEQDVQEQARIRHEIAETEAQMNKLNERLNGLQAKVNSAAGSNLPELNADLAAITEQLSSATDVNRLVDENDRYAALSAEVSKVETEAATVQVEIDTVRAEKAKILDVGKAKLEGLAFDDEGITYHGRRWDCMSGAEQLIVATSISRLLAPGMAFVLIDKLEQMDLETMQEFATWLKAEGLQAIGTRVSTGMECSIIIEDGSVK